MGGSYFFDDLRISEQVRTLSTESFVDGLRYRPGSWLWNIVTFSLTGDNAKILLVVLAAVNAVTCVMLCRLVSRFTTPTIAILVGIFWALLPNISAARFWITCTPNLFALTLCLWALLLATGLKFRGWRVLLALTMAVSAGFIYEGAIGLSTGAALLIAHRAPKGHKRLYVTTLAVQGVSAIYASSAPALDDRGEVGADNIVRSFLAAVDSALAGGLFADAGVAALVILTSFLLITFYRDRKIPLRQKAPELKLLLVGLSIVVIGAAPFVLSGFPIQNEGINDRANFYLSPGIAVILAALSSMATNRNKRLGVMFAIAICSVFALATFTDLVAYLDLVITSAGIRYPV